MENYSSVLLTCTSAEGLNLPTDLGSYFKLSFQQNIVDVLSYRIKQVVIPNTFYTIKSGQLVFGLQGNVTGHQNILIPAGNYTADQLSTYIATAWLALTGTTITVSFTSPDFKVIIARTAGVDATIAISATELALTGMTSILGFNAAIPANTVITAQQIFNITGPKAIYVMSNTLNTNYNMVSKDGQYIRANIIWAVWRVGNMGDLISNIIPSDFYQFNTPQKFSSLDLYLCDENLENIDLNGFPWSITLELRQKRNV